MRIFLFSFLLITLVSTNTNAQLFGHHWEAGYYYDKDGNKTSGFLSEYTIEKYSYSAREPHFLFKKDTSNSHIKIYAKDIRSFVVGKDSFVVSHLDTLVESPFLQVAIDKTGNPLKLYISRVRKETTSPPAMMPGAGGVTTTAPVGGFQYTKKRYYYGTDADNITEITRKNFKEVMTRIMAGKQLVLDRINDKTFRYGDMDDLVIYSRRFE